jgi:AcrR family transcriptional regulator
MSRSGGPISQRDEQSLRKATAERARSIRDAFLHDVRIHGLLGVSFVRVAEAIGVSLPAIGYYYSSHDMIIDDIVVRHRKEVEANLDAVRENNFYGTEAAAELRALAVAYAEVARMNAMAHRLFVFHDRLFASPESVRSRAARDAIAAGMGELVARHVGVRTGDRRIAAWGHVVVATLDSLVEAALAMPIDMAMAIGVDIAVVLALKRAAMG